MRPRRIRPLAAAILALMLVAGPIGSFAAGALGAPELAARLPGA